MMATPAEITGPMNIGNPSEFSMMDLVKIVTDLTGSRSRIVHHPLPTDDPKRRQPDISRAKNVMRWEPRVPLKDGLVRTIAYFEELLSDDKLRARLLMEPAA
jgi:UDP-glucuronate decarboxylase